MECNKLTIEQLKDELFRRGLPTSGDVGELCSRLQEAIAQPPLDTPAQPPPPAPAVIAKPAPPTIPTMRLTGNPPAPAIKPGPTLVKPIAIVKPMAIAKPAPVGPVLLAPLPTPGVPLAPTPALAPPAPTVPRRAITVVTPTAGPVGPAGLAVPRPLSPVRLRQEIAPEPQLTEEEEEEEVLPPVTTFVPMVPRTYENMTVAELRAELKQNNLRVAGAKAVLIDRLKDFYAGRLPPPVAKGAPAITAERAPPRYARGKLAQRFLEEPGAPTWKRFYVEMGIADLRKWLVSHDLPKDGTREDLLARIFDEIDRDAQLPDQHLDGPAVGCAGKVDLI